ncbi:hypothetical protein NDU88_001333 [Pleurodeles waltl]|uniref:Uncharacterized protein n=1 Tax=Pleurodeles waltl TaxID=8319 RepID=A0AAV7LZA4_PLEWA|nr:hypothetical protein NDU88_001333 [Pleurodeles waltl]
MTVFEITTEASLCEDLWEIIVLGTSLLQREEDLVTSYAQTMCKMWRGLGAQLVLSELGGSVRALPTAVLLGM